MSVKSSVARMRFASVAVGLLTLRQIDELREPMDGRRQLAIRVVDLDVGDGETSTVHRAFRLGTQDSAVGRNCPEKARRLGKAGKRLARLQ